MAKILVVDDSPDLLDFIALLLKMRKYNTETASSKKDMQEKLASFNPDIILLDVKLGGEDGRDICKAIKSTTQFEHIPVILLSAAPNSLINFEECEAADVLEKPFDIKLILEKINKHLNLQ